MHWFGGLVLLRTTKAKFYYFYDIASPKIWRILVLGSSAFLSRIAYNMLFYAIPDSMSSFVYR